MNNNEWKHIKQHIIKMGWCLYYLHNWCDTILLVKKDIYSPLGAWSDRYYIMYLIEIIDRPLIWTDRWFWTCLMIVCMKKVYESEIDTITGCVNRIPWISWLDDILTKRRSCQSRLLKITLFEVYPYTFLVKSKIWNLLVNSYILLNYGHIIVKKKQN